MKPLFNLVVVPSVEMSWIEDGGEKRKKKKKKQPHRNGGEKSGARGEKRHIKTAWGGGGGEGVGVLLEGGSGVSVENTELLSDGEQMSDCHCTCILYQTRGSGRRTVSGHLVTVRINARSAFLLLFLFCSNFPAADE